MDGGGRLLRSLGEFGASLATSPLAFAGSSDPRSFPSLPQAAPRLPRYRRRRGNLLRRTFDGALASRFLGSYLALALLGASVAYGAYLGGSYDEMVRTYGSLPDVVAKLCGFSIKSVTITGAHELREQELLKIAGIGPADSMLLLNVATVRKNLVAVPLIKDASVSKMFPNRLLIEIDERQPTALWQKDGVVSIVAADGTPIDDLRDARFETLPLVVGEGANGKLADYTAILDASHELRKSIRAGIYVSGRRWTLKMTNGIDIDLPEIGAPEAIARFAQLEHDSHVLEKDIISIDLRIPGRVVARLTEDAGAARAATLASKTKKKGAAT